MRITRPRLLLAILLGAVAVWLAAFAIERHYRADADGAVNPSYSLIAGTLYMGGNVAEPPPGTQAVLNLCEFADPYASDIHLWRPIRDAPPAPDLAWLEQQVTFVEAQQAAGRPTFVHCFQGTSRSGMVVVAYVMRKKHLTRDEALAFVRDKRPQTRPNAAFMELLLEWQATLKI